MTILKPVLTLLLPALLMLGCDRADTASSAEVAAEQKPAQPDADAKKPATKQPPLVRPEDRRHQPAEPGRQRAGRGDARVSQAHPGLHRRFTTRPRARCPNLKQTDDPQEISDRGEGAGQDDHDAACRRATRRDLRPRIPAVLHQDRAGRLCQTAARPIARRSMHELPKNMKVDVNTVYPTTLPLVTFPAGAAAGSCPIFRPSSSIASSGAT